MAWPLLLKRVNVTGPCQPPYLGRHAGPGAVTGEMRGDDVDEQRRPTLRRVRVL